MAKELSNPNNQFKAVVKNFIINNIGEKNFIEEWKWQLTEDKNIKSIMFQSNINLTETEKGDVISKVQRIYIELDDILDMYSDQYILNSICEIALEKNSKNKNNITQIKKIIDNNDYGSAIKIINSAKLSSAQSILHFFFGKNPFNFNKGVNDNYYNSDKFFGVVIEDKKSKKNDKFSIAKYNSKKKKPKLKSLNNEEEIRQNEIINGQKAINQLFVIGDDYLHLDEPNQRIEKEIINLIQIFLKSQIPIILKKQKIDNHFKSKPADLGKFFDDNFTDCFGTYFMNYALYTIRKTLKNINYELVEIVALKKHFKDDKYKKVKDYDKIQNFKRIQDFILHPSIKSEALQLINDKFEKLEKDKNPKDYLINSLRKSLISNLKSISNYLNCDKKKLERYKDKYEEKFRIGRKELKESIKEKFQDFLTEAIKGNKKKLPENMGGEGQLKSIEMTWKAQLIDKIENIEIEELINVNNLKEILEETFDQALSNNLTKDNSINDFQDWKKSSINSFIEITKDYGFSQILKIKLSNAQMDYNICKIIYDKREDEKDVGINKEESKENINDNQKQPKQSKSKKWKIVGNLPPKAQPKIQNTENVIKSQNNQNNSNDNDNNHSFTFLK